MRAAAQSVTITQGLFGEVDRPYVYAPEQVIVGTAPEYVGERLLLGHHTIHHTSVIVRSIVKAARNLVIVSQGSAHTAQPPLNILHHQSLAERKC